jgi:hypothetical protein
LHAQINFVDDQRFGHAHSLGPKWDVEQERTGRKKREAELSSGLPIMRTNNGNCLVDQCDPGHTLPHHSIIN